MLMLFFEHVSLLSFAFLSASNGTLCEGELESSIEAVFYYEEFSARISKKAVFHWEEFSTRSDIFSLENVMSMLCSLLLCVKFPQKSFSRRHNEELFNFSALSNCGKIFRHGCLLLGVAMGLICHWIPAHAGSGTSKYYCENMREVNFKETSLKRRNKCEIHWQAECHY